MAKVRLTDRALKGLSTDRAQLDVLDDVLDGFGVRVSGATGKKVFFVRYRFEGNEGWEKRRDGLGTYPLMPLVVARERAKAALSDAMQGTDPRGHDTARRGAETFDELADLYLERHARPNKAPASVREDERQLDKDLIPAWRTRKAAEIGRADVLTVLDAIVDRGGGVMANRTLALISRIFTFGIERGVVEQNPAYRVRRPTRERTRERVLTRDEIKAVWTASLVESPIVGATFRLRLLTAQRGKEILGMRHADLDGEWWTIPAAMSKTGAAHRVPLSPQALAVLAELEPLNRRSAWIFPSPRSASGHLNNIQKAAASIRDRSGVAFTPHDLRRTAATGMATLGVPRFTISKVLNHSDRTPTAVYDRAAYDAAKREALETWGAYVETLLRDG